MLYAYVEAGSVIELGRKTWMDGLGDVHAHVGRSLVKNTACID